MADIRAEVPVLEVVSGSDEEVEEVLRSEQDLPEAMPVLPLRDTVAYPDTLAPLGVGQERSIKLVDDVLAGNRMLVMVASRDPEEDTPSPEQLHDVGVVGVVVGEEHSIDGGDLGIEKLLAQVGRGVDQYPRPPAWPLALDERAAAAATVLGVRGIARSPQRPDARHAPR